MRRVRKTGVAYRVMSRKMSSVVDEAFAGLEKRLAKLNLRPESKTSSPNQSQMHDILGLGDLQDGELDASSDPPSQMHDIFEELDDLHPSQNSELDALMDDMMGVIPMDEGSLKIPQPAVDPATTQKDLKNLQRVVDDSDPAVPMQDVGPMDPRLKYSALPSNPRAPHWLSRAQKDDPRVEWFLYAREEDLPDEGYENIPNLTRSLSDELMNAIRTYTRPTSQTVGAGFVISKQDKETLYRALLHNPPKMCAIWAYGSPDLYKELLKYFYLVFHIYTRVSDIPSTVTAAILPAVYPYLSPAQKQTWTGDNIANWYFRNRNTILWKYVLYDYKPTRQVVREYYYEKDGAFPQTQQEWFDLRKRTSIMTLDDLKKMYMDVQTEALAKQAYESY